MGQVIEKTKVQNSFQEQQIKHPRTLYPYFLKTKLHRERVCPFPFSHLEIRDSINHHQVIIACQRRKHNSTFNSLFLLILLFCPNLLSIFSLRPWQGQRRQKQQK